MALEHLLDINPVLKHIKIQVYIAEILMINHCVCKYKVAENKAASNVFLPPIPMSRQSNAQFIKSIECGLHYDHYCTTVQQ